MAKRHHEWFVWPKDSHTNEVVARFACEGTFGFESEAMKDILCKDGKRRNLWRVVGDNIWILWRSRADLIFQVFNRLGSSKPRDVTFLFKNDRRAPKKKKSRKRPAAF